MSELNGEMNGPEFRAFEAYAGMDAPELPSHPWSSLQVQLARWQNATYPGSTGTHFVLGVIEEVGELVEALNAGGKYEKAVSDMEVLKADASKVVDAFADIVIYLMQLSTMYRIDLGVVGRGLVVHSIALMSERGARRETNPETRLIAACGELAHVALKESQGIRGMGDKAAARVAMSRAIHNVLLSVMLIAAGLEYADLHIGYEMLFAAVQRVAPTVMARVPSDLPKVER